MKNFTEPQQGTKIAEFKVSWFKNLRLDFKQFEIYFQNIIISLVGAVLLLDTSLFWFIRLIGLLLLIFSIYSIYVLISYLNSKYDLEKLKIECNFRTTKLLNGKLFSLFVVKDGLEINNIFLPYKTRDKDGIITLKLNENLLIIKTTGEPFVSINGYLFENEIDFKIDSKYLNCKDELLSYLNNQIDTSEAIFEEKKKKKKEIDIVGDYD